MTRSSIPPPKIAWGILSTAKIAREQVIPALQAAGNCSVIAIASREKEQAQAVADHLGIPKAHGSYEALLADPEVQVVYNPLPNHLHVPWSIRALAAGKHVLCEKPVGLNAPEAESLLATARQHPQLKVMEAFMYRFHPQWQLARRLVAEGRIGGLRTVHTFFSYANLDPTNYRNRPGMGGGGLLDIGCYGISLARFLFGAEPRRVFGQMEVDPAFGVDRLASAVLEFERGTATFTCATQLADYQRVNVFGTEGRLEIEIPFNAPNDRPCRVWHQHGEAIEEIQLPVCDQYTIQGERFAHAVLAGGPVPTPLEDAVANLRVLDAVALSARRGTWV